MRARLGELDPRRAEAAANEAAGRLIAVPEYAHTSRIALYAALPSELGTQPVFEVICRSGKTALFPRVDPERRVLEFCAVSRWEELEPGSYGFREPATGAAVRLEVADLVLVPGLAFDAAGHRLGRGGGWFDRTFPRTARPCPLLIGYAYEEQVVASVPHGPADRCVDWIVTERATRRAGGVERGE